jgi:hypothetical protein
LRPFIPKPKYATRRMRERAWAKADLERERAAAGRGGPSLVTRLLKRFR